MSIFQKGKQAVNSYIDTTKDFYGLNDGQNFLDSQGAALLGMLSGGVNVARGLSSPMRARSSLATEYDTKADELNPVRPNYEQSAAVDTMVGNARRDYETNRSAADAVYVDNVQRNQANSIEAARRYGNSGDVLATVAATNNGANNAYNNLAQMQENRRRAAASNYQRALMAKGQEEKNAYMYNQYQPYMMDLDRKYDLESKADNLRVQGADMKGDLFKSFLDTAATIGTQGGINGWFNKK